MRPLQDAIIRLLKTRPFYGQFLLQFRRNLSAGTKAVAVSIVDAVPTMSVNPQRFGLFSAPEQEALLEHLIKHVLHLHPCRRRDRAAASWDLACDLAINPTIANLPPEAPQPERLRLPAGLAAEDYYPQLLQLATPGTDQGRGEAGQRKNEPGMEPLDDHQGWQDAARTPLALAEQVVRQMVHSAWRKSSGELPGELQPLIETFLTPPQIPWQQILRQFVASAGRVGHSSTWKRSHRRFGQATPGQRKQQLLNLVVGVDVSESTDNASLREAFARELLQIARGRQSRICVLYTGSRIEKIASFSGSPLVSEVYRGGGFTDLRPVFEYARQLPKRPAAIIYLTDGYGPAPETSDIPTLWVLPPDGRKPVDWGLELRLNHIMETP